VKQKGMFYVFVTVPTTIRDNRKFDTACGGDLGIRTYLTTYTTNNKVFEYKHNNLFLKQLNDKLEMMKSLRTRPRKKTQRNKYRKKQLNKVEKKKIDMVNALHWSIINHLIKTNDVIFMGDIKSHDIVKDNRNKTLNRDFNDLKFYLFKQRLLYKSSISNKKVFLVNEAYTTQGCFKCGSLWKEIGDSKTFRCPK
jgi:putative transposase